MRCIFAAHEIRGSDAAQDYSDERVHASDMGTRKKQFFAHRVHGCLISAFSSVSAVLISA